MRRYNRRGKPMRGRCPSTMRVKTCSLTYGKLHKNTAHMSMTTDRRFFFYLCSTLRTFHPACETMGSKCSPIGIKVGRERWRKGKKEERGYGKRDRDRVRGVAGRRGERNGARQCRKPIRCLGMQRTRTINDKQEGNEGDFIDEYIASPGQGITIARGQGIKQGRAERITTARRSPADG